MTNLVTTAGATHIGELNASGSGSEDFDAMILSRGNDTPTTGDARDAVASGDEIVGTLVQVAAGYPRLSDADPRNTGSAATTWTWRFDVPAGVAAFVASNLVVTNYVAGTPASDEPLLLHARLAVPMEKRTEERAAVFVNIPNNATAGATTPTVVVARDVPAATPRLRAYVQRARALATFTGSASSGEVVSANAGESVRIMAHVYAASGATLTAAAVSAVTLEVRAKKRSGAWGPTLTSNVTSGSVLASERIDDARWPHPGGYNFAHTFRVPDDASETTAYRLRYTVRERAGTTTTMQVEIRTGAEILR